MALLRGREIVKTEAVTTIAAAAIATTAVANSRDTEALAVHPPAVLPHGTRPARLKPPERRAAMERTQATVAAVTERHLGWVLLLACPKLAVLVWPLLLVFLAGLTLSSSSTRKGRHLRLRHLERHLPLPLATSRRLLRPRVVEIL